MNLETVNIMLDDRKLSLLQKAILRKLDGTDKFWGLRADLLSWELAQELESSPGMYIDNRKEWRRQRREEEIKRFREKEINSQDLDMMLWFLRDERKKDKRLTPKWRSAYSRSLKRLEKRGFLYRVVKMKIEERNGKSFWTSYTGSGYTRRIVLEPAGRKWIHENKGGLG